MTTRNKGNNVYRGTKESPGKPGGTVTCNGNSLDPRFDLDKASPTGFAWGYGGAGPSQLALAVLARELGDGPALKHREAFKDKIIKKLASDRDFELTSRDIDAFLSGKDVSVRNRWEFSPLPRRVCVVQ